MNMYIGQGPEESGVQEFLSPLGLGVPYFGHTYMFTNPEIFRTSQDRECYEGMINCELNL